MITRLATAGILALAASIPLAHAQQLTSDELDNVKARLAQGATHRCAPRSLISESSS